MEPLKCILVDDEPSSLQNLQHKIAEFCPALRVTATAGLPEEALLLIRHHRPDVLFLDVEMPRMNGFRMLEELGEYDFQVVFTTAYNHYAIDAIRISAFDYLVKPVAIADLQQTANRLMLEQEKNTKGRMDILKQSLSGRKSQEDKMAVATTEGLEFIQIGQIVHIESLSSYSRIKFTDGKTLVVTRILKDFEELLLPYRFFRVHHSHLVNLLHIQKYLRGEGGQVIMQNGDLIDVSRRKKEEFLKAIGG